MRFEFNAPRILFGAGTLAQAAPVAREFGQRALVVTGSDPHRAHGLLEALRAQGVESWTFPVSGEPTISTAAAGAESAKALGCHLTIGFGGGSAIDTAKAIAALAANPGDPFEFLEVIGAGQPLRNPALPSIGIPTTAGTGCEVTRNAVLTSPEHRVKVSLRHASMIPRVAIVDPELTYSLPPELTATTGLDALTQLIEPYLSAKATPMTDALCVEGIQRAARSLREAWANGSDAAAREDMALASLFGGLALANAGLGAVHGFAGPLGGMFPIPHGAACASLLPHVMRTNLKAVRERAPRLLERFTTVAQLLTGNRDAPAEDGIGWIARLCAELQIPGLRTFGVDREVIPTLVEKAAQASSMKANPVQLTDGELREILEAGLL